ncbi:hypothetical protein ACHAXR_010067 [Thalassiosira sp. AJA248-18]
MLLSTPFVRALLAAATLFTSHLVCALIIMYYDLSGQWTKYALVENRPIGSAADYLIGLKSFIADILFVFVPFTTLCFWYKGEQIDGTTDSLLVSLIKLGYGYILGKLWATIIHYVLHHPILYQFHKRHHSLASALVASKAWEDSWFEYCCMEIPSLAIAIVLFPTHLSIHMVHFALHGYDGASNHSGFAPPGILGYLFNGEYHYYHHRYLNVNYAEVEIIDMLCGSHHTQNTKIALKQKIVA